MNGDFTVNEREERKKIAIDLTRYMVHEHYCNNNEEALIALFDDTIIWIGAGEGEYASGAADVGKIFRCFSGKVPRCLISDERYEAVEITPDVCLCTGSMDISTDPSEKIYLRVRQRITTIFRWVREKARCCHIHISNPYTEMEKEELGFPKKMARRSYEYMQQCITEQKRKIEAQTAELVSIYNTVPCVILRLLDTAEGCRLLSFNRALEQMTGRGEDAIRALCWRRGFCGDVLPEDAPGLEEALSELKKVGDSRPADYRVRNRFGKILHLSSVNTVISNDDQGRIIQRIAFDISRRKEWESALKRMSFEDSLTGVFNRNKFNREMEAGQDEASTRLGLAYFDLNGLKEINDNLGHSVGDALICRAARHISRIFDGKVYRIGGDEFVVVDRESDEESFRTAVTAVCDCMARDDISIAVGVSWRSSRCDMKAQFDEADKLMYGSKAAFYDARGRKRG